MHLVQIISCKLRDGKVGIEPARFYQHPCKNQLPNDQSPDPMKIFRHIVLLFPLITAIVFVVVPSRVLADNVSALDFENKTMKSTLTFVLPFASLREFAPLLFKKLTEGRPLSVARDRTNLNHLYCNRAGEISSAWNVGNVLIH